MRNEKVADKVRKLIAKSVSSTYDAEKASFAVEAVRLIHVHELTVGAPVIARPQRERPVRRKSPNRDRSMWTPDARWEEMLAPEDGTCSVCGGPFQAGDRVWLKPGYGVMHHSWPDPPCNDERP